MIAVIILNWNGKELLRRYLPSVLKHTPRDIAEVIVADNGSTDGSLQLLNTEFSGTRIIELGENYGFAEGYNRAVRQIAHEFTHTVLLNSDVEVKDDWLTPLHRFMLAHPRAGAIQPKILSMAYPDRFEYAGAAGGYLDRHGYPYCRGRIFDTIEVDHGQYDTPAILDWASGAAFMVDNSLYLECGGLDPKFFAHMEEIDLCWRMRLRGREIWAVPSAKVYHLGGGSLPAENPRKTYLNFRNSLIMLHKNLPDTSRRGVLLRRRLLDALAWAKFIVSGDIPNARAILKAHGDFKKMRKDYKDHPKVDLLRANPVNIVFDYFVRARRTFSSLRN